MYIIRPLNAIAQIVYGCFNEEYSTTRIRSIPGGDGYPIQSRIAFSDYINQDSVQKILNTHENSNNSLVINHDHMVYILPQIASRK